METRPLGDSALQVSRIGLGLAALGRPGYINLGHAEDFRHDYKLESVEARAHDVLDAAWKSGIRYVDAARSYGYAESFLSTWLSSREIAPESIVIGSKWGYTYTAGWKVDAEKHEVKNHTLPLLLRQFAESKGLLGSHLKLYQIHSATLESGVLQDKGVLEELARLRTRGIAVGLTLSGPQQSETLKRALDVTVDHERVFDCVQATWNLLEQSAGSILQEAHKAGMGIIIKESLANGRLTQRNSDPAFLVKRRLLEEVAAGLQTTCDALALAAVLAQPWADVVLSGAATEEHLQSNLGAVTVRWNDDIADKLRVLKESPQEYWHARSRLAWN